MIHDHQHVSIHVPDDGRFVDGFDLREHESTVLGCTTAACPDLTPPVD
ncbi:MAG: hypothetical protein IT532_11620 [Burkholderiales bacterium]|nr:hypothetical protein [Burkholderiales bacterium]